MLQKAQRVGGPTSRDQDVERREIHPRRRGPLEDGDDELGQRAALEFEVLPDTMHPRIVSTRVMDVLGLGLVGSIKV